MEVFATELKIQSEGNWGEIQELRVDLGRHVPMLEGPSL